MKSDSAAVCEQYYDDSQFKERYIWNFKKLRKVWKISRLRENGTRIHTIKTSMRMADEMMMNLRLAAFFIYFFLTKTPQTGYAFYTIKYSNWLEY